MDKENKKTKVVAVFILIVAVVLGVSVRYSEKRYGTPENDVATTTTESSTTSSEAETKSSTEDTEANEAGELDENGMTAAQREEWQAALTTSYDVEDADISIASDEGAQQKKIGNYYVNYDGAYATSGSIFVNDIKVNMIIYNDGDENDIKGYVIAYPILSGVEKPTTIDQCKAILSELIPSGNGYEAFWEETDNFFIRLVSGYSQNDSAAVMVYTFVPKRTEEANIYQLVVSASKSGTTITPISEQSFDSIANTLAEAASDSEIFTTDYDEVKESLVDIAYYETSSSENLGDMQGLAASHRNYLMKVYGTTDLDSLTADEIDELYWKFSDPQGYAEYQYYENGIGELDEDGNVIIPSD